MESQIGLKQNKSTNLSRKIEGNPVKISILQQVVQVKGEKLENKTKMISEDKVALELDDEGRIGHFCLSFVHHLQQRYLVRIIISNDFVVETEGK